jgi:hypothetical protein
VSGSIARATLGVVLACATSLAAAAPLYAVAQPQARDAPGVHTVQVKVIASGDPAVCRKAMPQADPGMFGSVGAHCVKTLPPELAGIDQDAGLVGAYVVKIADPAAPGPAYVARFGMSTKDVQAVCRNLLIYDRSSLVGAQLRTARMSCTPPRR